MHTHYLAFVRGLRGVALVAIVTLVQISGAAQSPPRTTWGDPDLQGTWDFTTITALERPASLGGREFLTESEAAALEKQINQQRVQTEEASPGSLGGVPRAESDPGIYNLGWWWEPNGRRLVRTRRSSLVVDPPDGRIPPLTTGAQAIQRSRDAARERRHAADDLPWRSGASWDSTRVRPWCRDPTTISCRSFRVPASS
jgi:hypothetical protein